MSKERIIFHIDVNSAYLSWSAAHRLQQGETLDLRTVPSVVGGSEASRHGIVLAKSTPAKAYKIQTGEPLRDAYRKCPDLICIPPDYNLYMKASRAMQELISEYSPSIQQFSIDECFLDYTYMTDLLGDSIEIAHVIKNRIKNELGFTVNIGISSNKLLAKMASDFRKPDNVHTLYTHQLKEKMWPLPVSDLFMVGRQTQKKLRNLGISTIGDLANADKEMLYAHLKSHGLMIWQFANGIDTSTVRKEAYEVIKGIGNSTTVRFDVEDAQTAYQVLLSLTEMVTLRLRSAKFQASLISISITTHEFSYASHQRKLYTSTDSTTYIFEIVKQLFDELWTGVPIRKLGVRVSDLKTHEFSQMILFERFDFKKHDAIDRSIDAIRSKYGNNAIQRACLLHSGIKPMTGGIGEDDYPMMTSLL